MGLYSKDLEPPELFLMANRCTWQEFQPRPGVVSTQGVGDCELGWAVDGQSAIRWHRGEALVWDQTWPSAPGTRKLSAGAGCPRPSDLC